jgi:exonuclease SbcD
MFRYDDDVIRAADIPEGFAAILSGHIHRHQILRKDLQGRRMAAPVLYPGSIERTSFAEKDERKGYLILDIDGRNRLERWKFHELPTRPMVRVELDADNIRQDFGSALKKRLDKLPADGIVSLRIRGKVGKDALSVLSAASLRSLTPSTMNVSVKLDKQNGPTSR